MLKKKNNNNFFILLAIFFEKNVTVFTNTIKAPSNLVFKTVGLQSFPPLHLSVDFSWTCAIDSVATHTKSISYTTVHDLWYNYKWDLYVTSITKGFVFTSNSVQYPNRVWLEREVSEFFPVYYKDLYDTRPLLNNYGENICWLSKSTKLQPFFELKTNWHSRRVQRIANYNVEL